MTTLCYIGIGSNLGQPLDNARSALEHLANHPSLTLLQASNLYSSKPHGPKDQPDYVNAVAAVSTELSAAGLLQVLFTIEQAHGRQRDPSQHWGPRTLDLDLLLYGDDIIDQPDLTVPHPHLCERSFVIYPLAELDPDLWIPGGGSLQDCKNNLAGDDLFLIEY